MIKFRLYIPPVILGFCYRAIIGMADGYCLSRTYIHVNFSGRNNILLSAPGCAYFSSGTTT